MAEREAEAQSKSERPRAGSAAGLRGSGQPPADNRAQYPPPTTWRQTPPSARDRVASEAATPPAARSAPAAPHKTDSCVPSRARADCNRYTASSVRPCTSRYQCRHPRSILEPGHGQTPRSLGRCVSVALAVLGLRHVDRGGRLVGAKATTAPRRSTPLRWRGPWSTSSVGGAAGDPVLECLRERGPLARTQPLESPALEDVACVFGGVARVVGTCRALRSHRSGQRFSVVSRLGSGESEHGRGGALALGRVAVG